MNYFPDSSADVEVIIRNNRPSRRSIYSGYRPAFKVKYDYLTTGIIKLINCCELGFGEETTAEIWFITPELYPNCLEIGQKIQFQEGKEIHGFAIITKINNEILKKQF